MRLPPFAARCNARSHGIARIQLDRRALTVIAATSFEHRIVRKTLPGVNVINAGIALSTLRRHTFGGLAIACGLAGGLSDRLSTGAVVIPEVVCDAEGHRIVCDPHAVLALRESAATIGVQYSGEPLLTTRAIVRGEERERWARRGFAAADMESAFLQAPKVAVVRVILDTPGHELSAAWSRPASVIFHPRAWLEIPWLAREAPRCVRLAARVIRNALVYKT
ncbi:MAG: hypothetical protein JO135_00210 [Candidatus Eremiobacteraeota bacterium]|nr:hypothetical protein [Candidatus Eremiobacteraeota bacterium]